MKLNKLLTPLLSLTTLSTVIVPITSCSRGSVEIRKHNNVKLTCDSVSKNKELKIIYELDSGFGFDVVNSRIVFNNGADGITLAQCLVDDPSRTITVPSYYVTSDNVVIDIRAESNSVMDITQDQYQNFWNSMKTPKNSRHFYLDGIVRQYHYSDTEGSYLMKGYITYELNGFNDHYYRKEVRDEFTTEYETWGIKDSCDFLWNQYYKTPDSQNKIVNTPSAKTYSNEMMEYLYNDVFGSQFDEKYTPDYLYNIYWRSLDQSSTNTIDLYLKFKYDTNKYLSNFLYTDYETQPDNSTILTVYCFEVKDEEHIINAPSVAITDTSRDYTGDGIYQKFSESEKKGLRADLHPTYFDSSKSQVLGKFKFSREAFTLVNKNFFFGYEGNPTFSSGLTATIYNYQTLEFICQKKFYSTLEVEFESLPTTIKHVCIVISCNEPSFAYPSLSECKYFEIYQKTN